MLCAQKESALLTLRIAKSKRVSCMHNTNLKLTSRSSYKIITVGASLKRKDGISRVVSELSMFFEEKLLIVTDSYVPSLTYELSGKSYILRAGHEKLSVIHFIEEIIILIALMLRLKRQKIINVTHNFYSAMLASVLKMLFPWKIKIYCFIYDIEPLRLLDSYSQLKPVKWLFTYLLKLGVIDTILVLDKRMAKSVHESLSTNKVFITRVGVSSSLIALQHKIMSGTLPMPETLQYALKKGKNSIKLFFHGILFPKRRVEDLILALNDVIKIEPDVVLYISGALDWDISYVNYLVNLVKKLRCSDHVYFLGPLSDEELAYMYYKTDIFIFPCDEQTWGLAPLEAMLFGKPAIVSTGTGVSEVLNDSVAILFPPKRILSLKEAILQLIKNENLRKRIGTNAQQYVVTKLTFKNTAKELMKLWAIIS